MVDFAFKLPAGLKIQGLNEKYLLKRAFKGMIPERVGTRPKKPYRAPIRELFFSQAPADYVDDLLSEGSIARSGYFNPAKVRRLFDKFRRADQEFSSEFQNMALVGILSTQLLHQQFVEGTSLRAVEQVRADRVMIRTSAVSRREASPSGHTFAAISS